MSEQSFIGTKGAILVLFEVVDMDLRWYRTLDVVNLADRRKFVFGSKGSGGTISRSGCWALLTRFIA